jgi:hypothetical protein
MPHVDDFCCYNTGFCSYFVCRLLVRPRLLRPRLLRPRLPLQEPGQLSHSASFVWRSPKVNTALRATSPTVERVMLSRSSDRRLTTVPRPAGTRPSLLMSAFVSAVSAAVDTTACGPFPGWPRAARETERARLRPLGPCFRLPRLYSERAKRVVARCCFA